MTRLRLLLNIAVAVVLAVILIALVIVHIDERASKHVSDPVKPFVQEVKFQ